MTVDIEGISKGELMVITAGRQTGKSLYHQYAQQWNAIFGESRMPAFSRMANAIVDGEQWYTVRCNKEVSKWVRTMEERKWQEHIDSNGYINFNVFDMHEKLYTMLAIKFS